MADSHPISAGTPGHMPVAYLQVSDLLSLSQFVHLFEDDKPNCDTPGINFASCQEINPNLGCSVKISISRSCLSLFIRLSLGSSPNSELIDREKQPILERVKTFNSRN
jgi:hypothetical protein